MLTIEEYIAKRKREDRLNEYDLNQRLDNMKTCVNYVFEYFNNYLDITEYEEKTVLKDQKLDKYRHQLRDYNSEVREWLVDIYDEYGRHMNRNIGAILKDDEFFLLYDSDSEYRSLSYDCYSKLIKKYPFLRDQTEMLFRFIKDYHYVQSQRKREIPFISQELNNWVDNTWTRYSVSVTNFAFDWAYRFSEAEDTWPKTHRKPSQYSWQKYEYDYKQKSNLFNLDSLYRKMPRKSFTKGKKQEFEILMMYFWLHDMAGDDEGYWEEYLKNVCPI
ncbi:hypothetical protein [Syntrophomonas wolfei]|uniref:Uncharacterized protein n=1 Tax=Syntrophomonas wolfei subsp. wolfei (strain DSM 2245B / Goettingen) TaxID=335541 RepID=Q0AUP5_SYNWW|nr:hypothetical protein [Syntrophomonas wolfei]ABI69559.1 conserved hypothetical protein [Syntrophomonas wolfei subsp. wolfei str. Goettingen G311]